MLISAKRNDYFWVIIANIKQNTIIANMIFYQIKRYDGAVVVKLILLILTSKFYCEVPHFTVYSTIWGYMNIIF